MIALIMLIIILTLSFGIKIKLKISQEESLMVAVFGMGILAYLLGLIGLLGISIYVIAILSLISLIYTIIKLKNKEVKIKELITLPTIIYSIAIILTYYIVKNVEFVYYDEYMFWGTNLKEMINKSCLWASSKIDGIHLIYPPFTAVVEYIFCKFNGNFNEGVTYLGIITLMVTSIMPIFKEEKYTIKSFFKITIGIAITYIALVLFRYNITCLSVDCILAIIFATSMFLAYKVECKKDYIVLAMLLISITLTKANGILFAGIVIMQLFIKEVFLAIKEKDKKILKRFLVVGILLATVITTYGTWKIYCTINGKQVDDRHDKNYTQNIDIGEFINAITQKEESSDRNKQIVTNFMDKLINEKVIRKYEFNTPIWIAIITNTAFLIYLIISKNKLNKLANGISINIGFILYILINILIYLFVFQETQGEKLASFDRYINTYLLAMTLNFIYMLLEETKWKTLIISFVMMLIMGQGLNSLMLDPRIADRMFSDNNEKQTIAKKADVIIENVKQDEKVYIIDQKLDGGTEFMKLRYQIVPIETNLLYEWNVGESQEGIYYKMAITETELIEKMIEENYNYVYVINIKESFLEEYKNILTEEAKKDLQEIIITEEYDKMQITRTEGILLKINKKTRENRKYVVKKCKKSVKLKENIALFQ